MFKIKKIDFFLKREPVLSAMYKDACDKKISKTNKQTLPFTSANSPSAC